MTRRKGTPFSDIAPRHVIELLAGPPPSGSAFASDAERRAAWEAFRPAALEQTRIEDSPLPWAFWEYEAPANIRDSDGEEGWQDFAARRAAWLQEHPFE